MNQATIFRVLVLVAVAIGVLGAFVDLLAPDLVPAQIADAYEAHMASEELTWFSIIALGAFVLILLIGGVAGTVGLLLFKRWGRSVCVWFSVLSVLGYPLLGPILYSGWALRLTETSMMLWGAALAMAYFSELRSRFEVGVANKPLQPIAREDARSG